jgi:hypothetical protein
MRDHDPWIFEMVWAVEHRTELRRLDNTQPAHQALVWRAGRSSESGRRRMRKRLGRLLHGLVSYAWLWLRRRIQETEGSA